MVRKLTSLLSYYFKSRTIHSVHSPLVYDMLKDASYTSSDQSKYAPIREVQRELNADTSQVAWKDLGAPSSRPTRTRTIGSLSKLIGTTPYRGHLLYHLATWLQAQSILELGTGCGISTCYLRAARPDAEIVSVDGQSAAIDIATMCIARMGFEPPTFSVALFQEFFDSISVDTYDLVLIDGDHRGKAILETTRRLQKHLRESALLIYDDIYWSADMIDGWSQLCDDKYRHRLFGKPTICLDLFHYGVIITDPRIIEDESMAIISSRWKPWTLGW